MQRNRPGRGAGPRVHGGSLGTGGSRTGNDRAFRIPDRDRQSSNRLHRRARHSCVPGRSHSTRTPPSGARGGAGGGPRQPALCHRHPEHAGLDDAQHRSLRPGLRAWPHGVVRAPDRPPPERRTGVRERHPAIDPLRLHAGRRQRRTDGAALGGADSRDVDGARLRRGHPGRGSGRYLDDPGAGHAGNTGGRREGGAGACESHQVGRGNHGIPGIARHLRAERSFPVRIRRPRNQGVRSLRPPRRPESGPWRRVSRNALAHQRSTHEPVVSGSIRSRHARRETCFRSTPT